ncbi:MAG: aspartate dehydrogenase [Lachnospiraceae bacterium]|nr:aspartate dehydrogenase [Lachnospiraceae bacterium]
MLFKKKDKSEKPHKTYDHENQKPVIRCSICTGEQVAGFKDIHGGDFEEIMLIRNNEDLWQFKQMYGIEGEIEKVY